MAAFEMPVEIRWADLDPNFHLRHTVYYDWAAMCRLRFLDQNGLTPAFMRQWSFGPILFREEAVFRKEIKFGDHIMINLELVKARKDYSRWTIQHTVVKNGDIVSAVITVDGAWLDTAKRKLTTPPQEVVATFSHMPTSENFQWLD